MKPFQQSPFILLAIGFLLMSSFYGCGGDSKSSSAGTVNDNTDGGNNPDGENGPTVSFAAEIQGPVFTAICIGCHFTGNTQGLPDFSEGKARQNLVNQDATLTDGGGKRVIPGDSANSILYQRISGIGLPGGEATMPFGDLLSLAESQPELATKIKTWIDEGALDN